MAGKGVSDIYCWDIELGDLKIYLASTDRGALRVGISLDKSGDCVAYFKDIFPSKSIIKDKSRNRLLIKSVEADMIRTAPPLTSRGRRSRREFGIL
jgi:hypothetical protein